MKTLDFTKYAGTYNLQEAKKLADEMKDLSLHKFRKKWKPSF